MRINFGTKFSLGIIVHLLTFINASFTFEWGYIVGYIFCNMLPLSKYHYLVSSVRFKDTNTNTSNATDNTSPGGFMDTRLRGVTKARRKQISTTN